MGNDAPLPVKFHAAVAFEKILQNKYAKELGKKGLGQMLQCYLKLMSELDNEELVVAFENMVDTYHEDISPYAVDLI